MKIHILKSKIHRATITSTNIDYEGSITIDPVLMSIANIIQYEQVHIWNITNGSRIITYAIAGEEYSGEICINGAGAKLNNTGDLIIVATFAEIKQIEAVGYKPQIIKVNSKNEIT